MTPEQGALIRQAADLEDTTVSAFVLEIVTAGANRVFHQQRDTVTSNEAFDRFIAELDKPAKPVRALVDLFKTHPKLPEGCVSRGFASSAWKPVTILRTSARVTMLSTLG